MQQIAGRSMLYAFRLTRRTTGIKQKQRVLSIKGLVSYIDPENEKSQKLAERLGATRDDEAPRQAPEDLFYRHLTL